MSVSITGPGGGRSVYDSTVWFKSGTDALAADTPMSGGLPIEIYHNGTGVSRTLAGADIVVGGELTAHATNNLELSLHLFDGGTEITNLGSIVTTPGGTGTWTGVEVFDTGIEDVVVAAGRSIRVYVFKNNAGVISPPYSIRLRWTQP